MYILFARRGKQIENFPPNFTTGFNFIKFKLDSTRTPVLNGTIALNGLHEKVEIYWDKYVHLRIRSDRDFFDQSCDVNIG